jgi:hypothetical protein
MMSNRVEKTPLDLDQYENFEIDQAYQAYVIVIHDLEESKAEDLEYEYMQQGYKIFSSEMLRQTNGMLTLKLIVGQTAGYTF